MKTTFQDFLNELRQADYREIRVVNNGVMYTFQVNDLNCFVLDRSVSISIPGIDSPIIICDDELTSSFDKMDSIETGHRAIYKIKTPNNLNPTIYLLKVYNHKINCLDCGSEVLGIHIAETLPPRDSRSTRHRRTSKPLGLYLP